MATVPSAPTNLVVTYAGSGAVSFSFTPGSNGGSAITNYQYSVDGGENFAPFNPVDTTSPIVLSGLENGVVYAFCLKAVNSVGVSIASSFVEHLVYGPADAPTGLTSVNRFNGIISLSFVEASSGGSTITNYEYSLDGGSTFAAFNPPQTTSPLSISGLTNNTQYSIVLRAVTEAPNNASSDTLNILYSGPGSFNNSGTFSNDGTISNLVTATINNTGIIDNTLSLCNIGTFANDVGGILHNLGPSGEIFNSILFDNSGTIHNTATFSNEVGATINNNDGGFLYTYDSGLLTNDGDINNAGIISTSSGGTCGAGTLTNNGTITDIGSGTQNTDCP
jgi:hypothetical protein